VPRGLKKIAATGTASAAALVLSILALLVIVPAFWSGLPPVLAAGGVVLGLAGRGARRGGLATTATAIGLLAIVGDVAIYAFEIVYSALTHPGNEQGLTPDRWEPAHATAYIVNAIVICTWVPFVEELTYRGLGYSLLERFGRGWAILGVGILFGLAHGLVLSLPVIVAFGCALAWVRAETDSVLPGMVAHSVFNAVALIAAVTIGS